MLKNALIPTVSYYTKSYAKYPIRAAGAFIILLEKLHPVHIIKKFIAIAKTSELKFKCIREHSISKKSWYDAQLVCFWVITRSDIFLHDMSSILHFFIGQMEFKVKGVSTFQSWMA